MKIKGQVRILLILKYVEAAISIYIYIWFLHQRILLRKSEDSIVAAGEETYFLARCYAVVINFEKYCGLTSIRL